MKVLSIREPWASLIVDGTKDVENRTWKTRYRGPVLIHASKTFHKITPEEDPLDATRLYEGKYTLGAIIGVANIIDCVSSSDSIWFTGPWGFELKAPKRITPIPCNGKLGFFTPDDETLRQVMTESAVRMIIATGSPNFGAAA